MFGQPSDYLVPQGFSFCFDIFWFKKNCLYKCSSIRPVATNAFAVVYTGLK